MSRLEGDMTRQAIERAAKELKEDFLSATGGDKQKASRLLGLILHRSSRVDVRATLLKLQRMWDDERESDESQEEELGQRYANVPLDRVPEEYRATVMRYRS